MRSVLTRVFVLMFKAIVPFQILLHCLVHNAASSVVPSFSNKDESLTKVQQDKIAMPPPAIASFSQPSIIVAKIWRRH